MANSVTPDTSRNLLQRLNAVMQEVEYIQREQKSGMRYKIVSHDRVTALLRPAFVKHGIVSWPADIRLSQSGNRTEAVMVVRFANIDQPEDCIDVHSAGYGIDDQDKGPGKAISYAVKYAMLKALGLESGDEPRIESGDDETDADQTTEHRRPEAEELADLIATALSADDIQRAAEQARKLGRTNTITRAQFLSFGADIAAKAKELGIQPNR